MNIELDKSVGGFFGLEQGSTSNSFYHTDAIALTSGRACLNLILITTKASKVYLPYYICDTVLIPLEQLKIPYEFYSLDQSLEPKNLPALKDNEYILHVNYFGLANKTIDKLYLHYQNRLIIDNTQAFFEKKYQDCWSFNSARKFFGVPDGAFLYTPKKLNLNIERNKNICDSHLISRALDEPNAYLLFRESEEKISADILKISSLSEKLLATVNYSNVIKIRKNNFDIYRQIFSKINQLKLQPEGNQIPFCYPLLLASKIERTKLSSKKIFIPTLWEDTINRNLSGFELEKRISLCLLPLPIDHRYNPADCQRVANTILEHI